MSQIFKHKADIDFFGNLNQLQRELQNYMDDRHQFTVHLTSANHADPLTEYQMKMINDSTIPFKDMSFLYNVKTRRTESLLGVFIAMFKSTMSGDDTHVEEVSGFIDIGDTHNVIQGDLNAKSLLVGNPIATITEGILVGTGTTAVTMIDNKLETLIGTGTSTGQLLYSKTQVSAMFLSLTEASFRISRSFGNQSGGGITVEEVGLPVRYSDEAGVLKNYLVERTLDTKPIADGENGLEAYTFRLTT